MASMPDDHAEDLLRRALIDAEATAAVALRVAPLALCETLTVVFHGRRDLGTIQTYVTHGGRGAGDAVGADELMRVPCDLDLAAAEDREEAEQLYAEQAAALRDALVGADTVLDIWREPLEDLAQAQVEVDRRIDLNLRLPAHRLLPAALVAPEKRIVVTAVCAARPPPAAGRAGGGGEAARGRGGAGGRAAGRGPPADGHRLRAAGRRACLPAARRPGALPGGLHQRRRRPRPRDGRAARAPGGL